MGQLRENTSDSTIANFYALGEASSFQLKHDADPW